MHVRLLDMGNVNILRSQSIYHAIASSMTAESDPAIIILRPEAPYVSIDVFQDANKEVDLQLCQSGKIPVIHRQIGKGSFFHDQNQLFLSFLFSENASKKFGLKNGSTEKIESLAQALILAFNKLGVAVQFESGKRFQINSKEIGVAYIGQLNTVFSFFCSMFLDETTQADSGIFKNPSKKLPLTSIRQELGVVPSLEGSAEALLSSFEEFFNIALIPSMPMPEEMDLIYEWDRKLMTDEEPSRQNLQKVSGSSN